jgi:Cd2+/Zn2+-exporting ATPase
LGGGMVSEVFVLENLACAHCAAKMESEIEKLDGVAAATLTFATKKLRLTHTGGDILPRLQEICAKIESEVKVIAAETKLPHGYAKKTYRMENLACAHCAAKMESEIEKLDGVKSVIITYSTKKMQLIAKDHAAILPQVQAICQRIEADVRVVSEEKAKGGAPEAKKNTADLIQIAVGAVLFIAAMTNLVPNEWKIGCLLAAYAVLGWELLVKAGKNFIKGQLFDENFLMTIAAFGAFYLKEYEEGVGVVLFYRIGECFEEYAVEKSRRRIMDVVDLRPEEVTLALEDGSTAKIAAEDAKEGDIILVKAGERVPLDGVVIAGETQLDTSPITGEPVPLKAVQGTSAVSGYVNLDGVISLRVEKVLSESMVTKILDSMENAAAAKPKIERFITRFARVYTPFVVGAAVLLAIIPSLVTGNWDYWLYTAITFLVMSCPCALVLSVPLAFFSGIGIASKAGILLKGGAAIEGLNKINLVAMDKTGTITKGEFAVQKIDAEDGFSGEDALQLAASLEKYSTHPIAVSISQKAQEDAVSLLEIADVKEQAGRGIEGILAANGAKVLCGSKSFLEENGVKAAVKGDIQSTEVYIACQGKFVGCIYISDAIKDGSAAAVADLKRQGLKTAMLTGDGELAAEYVAKAAGIDVVKARLLPQDKLAALQELRKENGAVMFVGDGINDAPVLAGADVGAAMGSGADAAMEAADVVFMTSDMRALPQALAIAKATNKIAWQNVVLALGFKAAVMIVGIFGMASLWLAVFADSGVAMLCVLNSIRMLFKK